MESNNRLAWVDIAKGIAIIAVVAGHIGFSWPKTPLMPMRELFTYLWHVPVFFMLGGFFLKEEKLVKPKVFILGKIKSLYLPLLYLYIPVLLFHNLFIRVGFYDLSINYFGKYISWWRGPDLFRYIVQAILCAGREPLLGAMWFGFVLFLAFCIISLLSWFVERVGGAWKESSRYAVRGLLFLILALLSWALTNLFDFTIPRFNNTLIAVWLIYVGMLMFQKARITFSNGVVAAGCALVAWQSVVCWGGVNLVANEFKDVIVLTVTSGACLYVICYISKCAERITWFKKALSCVGRGSLYIMGLHFLGFKMATMVLNLFGAEANLAILVPKTGGNVALFVYYVLFGVGVPLLLVNGFRCAKTQAVNKLIHKK